MGQTKKMPSAGLSRWARVYIVAIALLGICAIAQSGYELYALPIGWNWFILAVLTLISGSATVKLPSVPATISISETFVFTSVLLFGPAAGTLTVALDALVISFWLARRGHPFYRIVFNICALPASLWVGAHVFYWIWGGEPLSTVKEPLAIGALLVPLVAFTITYYLLNSWLIAFAISLEKKLSAIRVWRENFAWLSLNYFGGASVAALLVSYTRNIDYTYVAFILPLLAVLYFTFSMSMGRVEDANRHLTELNALYMSTIETLAMAIDAKDQITHGHIRRVQHYAVGLAKALGVKDSEQIRAIEAASLLHDMGKLAVPEYILNKPGALTPAEFEKMKLHASVGADILSAIDFPYPVVPIVRHHHESWNGSGYPDGLSGSQIPIGARILSVVDCFDALTSDRPYRPRLTDTEAIKILVERRGTMYDPLIVDTFIRVHRDIAPSEVDSNEVKTGFSAIGRTSAVLDSAMASDLGLEGIAASTEEMVVLYDLAKGLAGHSELTDAADLISRHIRRVVPATTCVLYVHDEESDELYVAHAAGQNATDFSGLRIPRGQRLTGWVAANRRSILNSDPVLDLGEAARSMQPRLRSCLSTPLQADSTLVGVLTLYSPQRDAFSEDHRRILEAVAKQVTGAIQGAIMRQRQPSASAGISSESTSLPNQQHLRRFVESELSTGGTGPLSLILVEFRSLSAINRKLGKDVSNRTIAKIAASVRSLVRGADVLFQYGPDDFVVLLTGTDITTAAELAARIGEKVSEDLIEIQRQSNERIALALGVATAPSDGVTVEDLVKAARGREGQGPDFPPHFRSVH